MEQNGTIPFSNDHKIEVYIRYPDEAFLKELGVTDIKQRFSSNETQYVIGNVSVDSLTEKQPE